MLTHTANSRTAELASDWLLANNSISMAHTHPHSQQGGITATIYTPGVVELVSDWLTEQPPVKITRKAA